MQSFDCSPAHTAVIKAQCGTSFCLKKKKKNYENIPALFVNDCWIRGDKAERQLPITVVSTLGEIHLRGHEMRIKLNENKQSGVGGILLHKVSIFF